MKFIKQNNYTTCGQSCLAMLLNISLKEAIKLVGHNGITTNEEILSHIHNRILCCIDGIPENNHTRTYLCKHKNPNNSKQEHWTILYHGVRYDPASIEPGKLWPVYKYWIIE